MERTPLKVDFGYIAQSLTGPEYALLDLIRSRGKADFVEATHGTNATQRNIAIYTLEQKALCEMRGNSLILTDYGNRVHDIIDADSPLKSQLVSSALMAILENEMPRESEMGMNMRQALEIVRR
ncbi:MAG: hypothetical protein KGH65_05050 [Candidatus Micrarchaeota archaeon]|nr:hypothetical protein [Candidatus Micrarchaeota archaeon]